MKKQAYAHTHNEITPIALTDTEFLILANILHQINRNLAQHHESTVTSDCTFLFDKDYGIYDSFRDLLKKVYTINLRKALQSFKGEDN